MAGLPPALNLSPLVYAPVLTKNTAQFSEITPARARVETACYHACHTILVSNRETAFFFHFPGCILAHKNFLREARDVFSQVICRTKTLKMKRLVALFLMKRLSTLTLK